MPEPLAGIRVVDLTAAVLGPAAKRVLGDIHAERRGGDPGLTANV
jgi:crotonobetainyl-CoA:carnitine CoA-transferase CaiB-like acyl-CoA transferase